MAKKRLRDCRTGKDIHKIVKKAAARGDVDLRPGKGSHWIAKNNRGACVYPVHNDDLGIGIRTSIVKTLRIMGLGAGLLAFVLVICF